MDLYASPNSRLFIARSLRDLGRIPEAVTEFELVVGEASDRARTDRRYASTAEAARAELQELEARVGRLTVHAPGAPPTARVRIGARPLPPAVLGLAVPVEPGTVTVEIAAEGYETARREVQVAAGQHTTMHLTLRCGVVGHGRRSVLMGVAGVRWTTLLLAVVAGCGWNWEGLVLRDAGEPDDGICPPGAMAC